MAKALWYVFVTLLNLLPRRLALGLGASLGGLLYRVVELTRFRGAVRNTIRTAFPNRFSDAQVVQLAIQHARDLVKSLVEVARFREVPRLLADGQITTDGLSHLERAKERGSGVIILSAHMGNWELLIASLGLLGHPVHAVVVRQTNQVFNEWLTKERARFGSKVIYADEVTGERVGEILSSGGILLLLADHHHYGGSDRNIVEFFGKPVSAPGGPVAYATRFGAPLLPGYTIRKSHDRHHIVFEPPLELVNENDAFAANCRRYISVFERWIRRYPDQWMWSHERWAWLKEDDHTDSPHIRSSLP